MQKSPASYPGQINSLTSLRYLAASWVVLFHFREYSASDAIRNSPISLFGYLGVDFFFVLSGFVLTHVYKNQITSGLFDYWSFIAKRFGRVYPMHLITLGVFLALGALSSHLGLKYQIQDPGAFFATSDRGELFRTVIAHLTLIHAWGATEGLQFNSPSWSISAEWFAYLIFPIYMIVIAKIRGSTDIKLAFAVGLFAIMSVFTSVALHLELTKMTWNIGILRIAPEFFLGIALYAFGETRSFGRQGIWIGLATCLLTIGSGLFVGSLEPALGAVGAAITVLGLAGAVLFTADADRHGLLRPLSHPFAVFLGEISYSVYMLHLLIGILVFELLAPGLRPSGALETILAIAGALALTTLLSWLSYKVIETPGRNLVVSWTRRLNNAASRG